VIAIAADGSVGELPEGAAAAVAPTADGYAVEIALPAAMAAELAGGDGRRLRVNIAQYDLDADGSTQLWWRASWINSATSYGHSGTFEQRPAASP